MARFRKVWLALVVCGLVLGGSVTAMAGGPGNGNGKGQDKGKPAQAAPKADKADKDTELDETQVAEEIAAAEEIAEVADEFEESAGAEVSEKQAEAAAKLAEAEKILADAQAAAEANPAKAEQILAKAQEKAAALRAKAEQLVADAEARATEVRLKVEGAHMVSLFHKAAAKAKGEEKELYKDLAKLFHQGLWFVGGVEMPEAEEPEETDTETGEEADPEAGEETGTETGEEADEEEAPAVSGIALTDLAEMLGAKISDSEEGPVSFELGGIEISFADGEAVMVNGMAVTEEFLAVLPDDLSPEAQFLKSLLLGTVSADAEGNLTVTLAEEPAAEEPADDATEPEETDDSTDGTDEETAGETDESTESTEGTEEPAN